MIREVSNEKKYNHILIIDDDKISRETLTKLLEQTVYLPNRYSLKSFKNSRDLFEWTNKNNLSVEIPLVIADFFLDKINPLSVPNGIDVLKRIKYISPRTRCVLYSGIANRSDLEPAFNEKIIDAFFDKSGFVAVSSGFIQRINNLLDDWNKEREHEKGTCFVIMKFGSENDEIYENLFKPALRSLGYSCLRQDESNKINRYVTDDIIRNIKDASVILADITSKSPNVFYEIGIAHTMSKPVILFSQSIEDCPFDIQNYPIYLYDPNVHNEMFIREVIIEIIKDMRSSH